MTDSRLSAQETFRAGELVVHPAYGFCRIQAVERASPNSQEETCYVILMGSTRNPIKVLIRVTQAEAAGLRRPLTREQAEAVLRAFDLPAQPLGPNSKEQLEGVEHRLKSGDLFEVAGMVRDLAASGVDGWPGQTTASFMNRRRNERMMLGDAVDRLVEELAHAQRVPRKQVEQRIQACLRRTRRARTVHAAAG